MQVLFDLIHTLTKEEKRLYNLHGKGGRLNHIYDAYVRAISFQKSIDQQVYKEHFNEVTRAFYSMQKRALLDDLLSVLLQFSNNSNPAYQYLRSYMRGMILLQRQMGDGAYEQLADAVDVAQKAGFRQRQRTALLFQNEALMKSEKPSFELFSDIERQLESIRSEMGHRNKARKVLHAMTLLYNNYDEQPRPQLIQQANNYLELISDFDITNIQPEYLPTIIKILKVRMMHAEITDTVKDNHKELLTYYHQYASKYKDSEKFRYETLNLMLRSALRAGDFLNLQGAIYKVDKDLAGLSAEVKKVFLPGFLETAALYYFFEKDLVTALEHVKRLLEIKDLDMEVLNRCTYYRLAMLIAANQPKQAKTEIEQYQKRMPNLLNNPILWVIRVVLALEDNAEGGEILLMIERIKIQLRKMKDIRKYQDNLYLIEGLIEKKKVKMRDSHLFPQQWEQLLRIDLLLLAKKQNNFYYNLLVEPWDARKQVY